MNINFSNAKDGSQTFSIDNIFFHSTYSPLKEAERFVQNFTLPYNPKVLIIIEPGFSYVYKYFKEKYPKAKIGIIRLIDQTLSDSDTWDFILNINSSKNISNQLMTNFSEEELLSSSIVSWKPAENLFHEKINQIYSEYKEILNQSKTVLTTRQFFEKKWFINSCNFFKYTKKIATFNNKINVPVVICASGPSLKSNIELIRKHQNNIFIIALSSAFSVLISKNICPDLILTTDGGFWAGEHLKKARINKEIPIACPAESYIPKKILNQNPIICLNYNDIKKSFSTLLTEFLCKNYYYCERNGTVSGTALRFSQSLTTKNIYFCGLDLSGQNGFQHTQPNELEKNNCIYDNRIKNSLLRNMSSRFNSSSLKIYENWFVNCSNVSNIFRVINENEKNNSLGNIKDISTFDFENDLLNTKETKSKNYFKITENSFDSQKIYSFVIEKLQNEEIKHQLFPADYLSIENSQDKENTNFCKERLSVKINKLLIQIRKIFDV